MILDHIGFGVGDFAASRAFLVAALSPLGIGVVAEGEGWAMLGRDGKGQFWFGRHGTPPGPIHIAFAAQDRAQVRAFHAAALAAGGRDNGGPGIRAQYHPTTTARSSSVPTGTTSRRSATRRKRGAKARREERPVLRAGAPVAARFTLPASP